MATKTKSQPSPATIRDLSKRTLDEGLAYVRARHITEALWRTGEAYHAGAIETAEWKQRNERLWREAERHGEAVVSEVRRQLRNAR